MSIAATPSPEPPSAVPSPVATGTPRRGLRLDRRALGRAAYLVLIPIAACLLGASAGLGISPLYALAPLAILGFLVFSVAEPQIAVVAIVALGMGRVSDALSQYAGLPSPYKPLIAFAAVLFALRLLLARDRTVTVTRTELLLLLYFSVYLLAASFASDFNVAMDASADLITDLILIILIANLLISIRGVRWVIWAVMAVGAGLSALTIYQAVTGNFGQEYYGFALAEVQHIVGDETRPRSAGPFGDPNFYAQYLLIFGTLALFRAIDERAWLFRAAALGIFILNLAAIQYTFSRGAIVAMLIITPLILYLRRPSWKLVVLGFLVLIPLLMTMPASFTDRITTVTDLLPGSNTRAVSEISFRGRQSELMAGISMFADHPILGVGPNNYPLLYQEYAAGLGLEYRREDRSPHSLLLQIGAETGIIGLAIFGIVLLSIFADLKAVARAYRRVGDRESAALAESIYVSICAFLAAGLFLHLAYPRGLWLLVGLGIAMRHVARRHFAARAALTDAPAEPSPNPSAQPTLAPA